MLVLVVGAVVVVGDVAGAPDADGSRDVVVTEVVGDELPTVSAAYHAPAATTNNARTALARRRAMALLRLRYGMRC